MQTFSRTITRANIDQLLRDYLTSTETIGDSISTLRGIKLLEALKRGVAGAGPYPKVSVFEAANRIMTDLVILYGVRSLLGNEALPFNQYTVEYGHENNEQHDIMAESGGRVLIAEAFNVAPSFFPVKKGAALKKLRRSGVRADYKMIVCNSGAVPDAYAPKPGNGEFLVLVDVGTGISTVVPGLDVQATATGRVRSRRA